MATIFVVSPMYLEIIIRESKRFSFDLQGYGSFELAKKGLLKVNATDLIGYGFISDSMPNIETAEYNNMLEFLNLCNLMGKRKFVVITRNALQGRYVGVLKQFSNLEFYVSSGNEYITDSLINTNVFGSLLMTVREPYKLKPDEKQSIKEFVCPTMHLVPAVNNFMLQCLDPISKLESIEQTKEYDSIYQDYVKTKSVLALLREIRILSKYEKYDKELCDTARTRIEDGVRLGKIPASCMALCEIVLEEAQNVQQ